MFSDTISKCILEISNLAAKTGAGKAGDYEMEQETGDSNPSQLISTHPKYG
jgi:hypothetical protein